MSCLTLLFHHHLSHQLLQVLITVVKYKQTHRHHLCINSYNVFILFSHKTTIEVALQIVYQDNKQTLQHPSHFSCIRLPNKNRGLVHLPMPRISKIYK
uniref:Uncharacterized protein n=1 Tax=Magallana gigas TaxID=29159 RepID=K1RSF9_MAGGI